MRYKTGTTMAVMMLMTKTTIGKYVSILKKFLYPKIAKWGNLGPGTQQTQGEFSGWWCWKSHQEKIHWNIGKWDGGKWSMEK